MIVNVFVPDAASLSVVEQYRKLPPERRVSQYWSDPAVSTFKAAAKTHYLAEQAQTCCYCRKVFPSNNMRIWDLDHILARSVFPEFMFEPRNLAISCVDCNGAKSDKDTSRQSTYRYFPKRSASYLIVHPHFDEFDDHISVFAGYIYTPRAGSAKGKETISRCNLTRFADVFEGRKGRVCDSRYEADVAQLLFAEDKAVARAAMRKLMTAFEEDDDDFED